MKKIFYILTILIIKFNILKNTRLTIDDESIDDYYSLPNEFPELISILSQFSKEKRKRIEKLRKLIGYLPFPEQRLLFIENEMNSSKLFDFSTFKVYYERLNNSKEKIDIYQKEIESISKYVENYEKSLSYGLGCLKAVTQQFGYKTDYNIKMTNRVYENINIILKAQEKLNKCTSKFIHSLQIILVKRRKYLFTLESKNIKLNDSDLIYESNNKNFCYNDEGEIISIRFSENDKNTIVDAFIEYSKCKENFNQILSSYLMDSEISISQMDDCINFQKINENAGNSSKIINEPTIVYKNGKKQIGINNINLIRSDQRTSNGYLLNFGFGFGNSSRDNKTFPFPFGFYEKINSTLNLFNEDFQNNEKKPSIKSSLNYLLNNEEKRPFKDLYNSILEDFKDDENKNKTLLNLKKLIEENNNYSISCNYINDSKTNNPIFSCSDYSNLTSDNAGETLNLTKKNTTIHNFSLESIEAIKYKSKYYIYSTAIEDKKRLFSFIYNGEELESKFYETIQSCFGVFSSGGYNDKEACRDIIKEKCGTEIDYKCKKSGLYDYINSNPVSNYLPHECSNLTLNKNECFDFIDKHFLLGSIAIKPSSLLSFSLLQQANVNGYSLNKENHIPVSFFYGACNNNTFIQDTVNDDNIEKFFNDTCDNIQNNKNYFPNILGSNPYEEGDISIQHYYVDQGNYFLLKSKEYFLCVNIVFYLIYFLIF